MTQLVIIVDKLADWSAYYPSEDVVTADQYLSEPRFQEGRACQVINLCRSTRYLSLGYYCSLLAEARGHRVLPSVKTINDLSQKALYGLEMEPLADTLNRLSRRDDGSSSAQWNVRVYFGQTRQAELEQLARQVFEIFPAPVLEIALTRERRWEIGGIRSVSIGRLDEAEQDFFAAALDRFSKKIWRKPRARRQYRYELAMLHNPEEKLPPSNRKALSRFIAVGKQMGVEVTLIERRDYVQLAEYDALFIRETTSISDHTYRFAKRAEAEGLVVMDDPQSILRCGNKIYLADMLRRHRIDAPRTAILSRESEHPLEQRLADMPFPLVLKIPDGSFSRGVVKVEDPDQLRVHAATLFEKSALILAQEFLYTDFDWRIGILNRRPIFACQYFMSKNHWQIYKHNASGSVSSGDFRTVPVQEAPRNVVKSALKVANQIGSGLYGVDMKQSGERAVVIEINDNPNIDAGVEDLVLGDELYRMVIGEFVRRLEARRLGLKAD